MISYFPLCLISCQISMISLLPHLSHLLACKLVPSLFISLLLSHRVNSPLQVSNYCRLIRKNYTPTLRGPPAPPFQQGGKGGGEQLSRASVRKGKKQKGITEEDGGVIEEVGIYSWKLWMSHGALDLDDSFLGPPSGRNKSLSNLWRAQLMMRMDIM
jgi:hypothetical protein